MRCPHCLQNIPAESTVCPYCSTRFSDSRQCFHDFPVSEVTAAAFSADAPSRKEKPRNGRAFLLNLPAVICFFLAAAVFFLFPEQHIVCIAAAGAALLITLGVRHHLKRKQLRTVLCTIFVILSVIWLLLQILMYI